MITPVPFVVDTICFDINSNTNEVTTYFYECIGPFNLELFCPRSLDDLSQSMLRNMEMWRVDIQVLILDQLPQKRIDGLGRPGVFLDWAQSSLSCQQIFGINPGPSPHAAPVLYEASAGVKHHPRQKRLMENLLKCLS